MITMSKQPQNVCEILNEVPDIKDNENPVYTVKDGSISFKNVNFSHTDNVDKLSLKNF